MHKHGRGVAALLGWALLGWALLSMMPTPASAQTSSGRGSMASQGSIYSCTDASGRAHTSDRPIAACSDRDQIERGRDGTVRRVLPPSMSVLEIEADQERRRREQQRLTELRQRQRADKLLLSRYPDEASHQRARIAALEAPQAAIRVAQTRLAGLQAELGTLQREAEFYVGRTQPMALQQQLEVNDAAILSQHQAIRNQQAEIDRINANFDAEMRRLRELRADVR